ncbi:hypothetical protein GPECTOR_296g799 [Gonium pectorale]|uniref:Protein kinase domain-containing protein n=1 Tax=Gonium pectorale TaxID=33097 RepID=A0A150FVW4_GONPE|nr:hypothetical protein GPECTOR_296g799 [Gonium pectorale]|eukprot:KXZ41749.1 hypothetical protein GPECTOR_296g799 [Gonium pectorale]
MAAAAATTPLMTAAAGAGAATLAGLGLRPSRVPSLVAAAPALPSVAEEGTPGAPSPTRDASAHGSPSPLGPAWGCPRRPVTLRLRCLVRDPLTSSLLATARGHVDDPQLPIRRPAGAAAAAAAAAGGGVGGGAPGSLLLVEEAVLGRGAFGFVTLVSDAVTGKLYALKRLKRAAISAQHVMQEQQAVRALVQECQPGPQQPQDEHYLYCLLEYCPGGDLDRLVRRTARKTLVPRRSWLAQVVMGPCVVWRGLPEAAARFYAAGVVLALQELHTRYIVFRDLKPGNVLLDGQGYPRLCDFGLAKQLDGPAGRATSACGTLDYMVGSRQGGLQAPEVVKIECEALAREGGPTARELENWVSSAAAVAGQRRRRGEPQQLRRRNSAQGSYGLGVDWWSFGVLLYVLLTGSKPFSPPEPEAAANEDPARLLVRIINPWFELPLPVYISPHARDLLRRLLVRQPRWRLGCGGGGAEEVMAHPFFQGFDWEAYRARRTPPPYPVTEVSLPEEAEAQSVADFFGYRCSPSTLTMQAAVPPHSLQQPQPQGQEQQQGQQPQLAALGPARAACAGQPAQPMQQQEGQGQPPARPEIQPPQARGQGPTAGGGATLGEELKRQAAQRRKLLLLQQQAELLQNF